MISEYINELEDLIYDINMNELKDHIADYDLGSFVRSWQSEARTTLRRLEKELKGLTENED